MSKHINAPMQASCATNFLHFNPIAIKSLPKDFSVCSERDKLYLLVKSVLAAIFMWQDDKIIWQGTLTSITSRCVSSSSTPKIRSWKTSVVTRARSIARFYAPPRSIVPPSSVTAPLSSSAIIIPAAIPPLPQLYGEKFVKGMQTGDYPQVRNVIIL